MKKTRFISEVAVSVSLAVICSFIRVWQMPQGGSVALTMVPIFLVSLRCGAAAGMLSGAIYGTISLMLEGVVYHPMSILLDYILAFAALGIAGFFPKTSRGAVAGVISGAAVRFLSSTLSGAVLFASFAPVGQNPLIYSLGYQASYMIPETLISLVCVLYILRKIRPVA